MKRKIFISYAHDDRALFEPFIDRLEREIHASTTADAQLWIDRHIIPGHDWDATIRAMLDEAALGVLLISKAFRCSRYIQDVELAALLAKGCVPVGLEKLCLSTQLCPTIQPKQLYLLRTPRRAELFFSECSTRQQRDAFVHGVYQSLLQHL